MKKLVLLIFLYFMFSAESALSADYYVRTDGNDSTCNGLQDEAAGDGSCAWATVQKAANTVVAGDTVNIGAGTYAEYVSETTSGSSGLPISYVGAGKSLVTVGGFNISGSYVNVSRVNLNGTGVDTYQSCLNLVSTANYGVYDDISITGSETTAAGWYAVSTEATNGVFTNITVTDPHGSAFNIMGDDNLIEDCIISDHNGWDAFRPLASNITIRRCSITLYANEGNTNHQDVLQTFNVGGIYTSHNVVFEANYVRGGSYNPTGNTQLGNFEDDQGDGAISNWIIRNNIFIDIPRCFNVMAPYFSFYNNTFFRCGTGSNWVIIWMTKYGIMIPHHTVIKNNIFYLCGDPTSVSKGWYGGDAYTYEGMSCDYNLVIGSGAGTTKNSDWTAHGYEEHGINGSDPLLDGSYRLGAGSPAIGAGVDLSSVFATDFSWLTRTAPWDMGARKYSTSAPGHSGLTIGNKLINGKLLTVQ
jgi:hypothetical protein